MTPDADASVHFLTKELKYDTPFVFTKFGDGDLYWMDDNAVPMSGGEPFRQGLPQELRDAARVLTRLPHAYFGDQRTCSSGPYLIREQATYVPTNHWLHFECLLLHRLTPHLLDFYHTIRSSTKRKLFVGGWDLGTAILLDTDYIATPKQDTHKYWKDIAVKIGYDWDILLLSCGRASKMIAATMAAKYPDKTVIELGSAMDPLYLGRTRSEQVDQAAAREYFKELLNQ